MTNQNDTQDEAEQEALKEICNDSNLLSAINALDIPIIVLAMKRAYSAGVSSRDEEYKRSPLSLALCKSAGINVELMEDMEKLKRENEQLKTALETQTRNMGWLNNENTLVETKLAASRAEVERLKADFNSAAEAAMIHGTNHDNLSDIYLVLRKQLADEKQKALKLVEALEIFLDDLSSGPKLSKVTEALANYSTDSGDGEKG